MVLEESLRARKEWILENSRCCEVLDSEFFYQVKPTLDIALLTVSDS